MDSSTSILAESATELNFTQPQTDIHQPDRRPEITLPSHSDTANHSQFPSLLPDHPIMQVNLKPSPTDTSSFPLVGASCKGDGVPLEGLERHIIRSNSSDMITGNDQMTQLSMSVSTSPRGSKRSPAAVVAVSTKVIPVKKKPKGKPKGTKSKGTAAAKTPRTRQMRQPNGRFTPEDAQCTQPSVELEKAVNVPLVPESLPDSTRNKRKRSSHNDGGKSEDLGIGSPFQSSERASLRLVAEKCLEITSTDASQLSHDQFSVNGQHSKLTETSKNKREPSDDGAANGTATKRRKKNTVQPMNDIPSDPYNGFSVSAQVPLPISSNGGEMPLYSPFLPPIASSQNHASSENDPSFQALQQYPIPSDPSYQSHPPPPPPFNYYAMSDFMPPRHRLFPVLQHSRCMSARYKPDVFPRCVSCTRRWAGDTCRFQGIRFFLKDAEEQRILGITFVDSQTAESPTMDFPDTWNVLLKASDRHRLKPTVARALLPILKAEQEHLRLTEVIRRPRETEVRATCDTCMTSIFACAWMCRVCGREACKHCFDEVRELTYPTRALLPSGEKKCHSNPLFLSCNRRQEHSFKDFSPVSRFCSEELDQVVTDMERLVEEASTGSGIPSSGSDPQWGSLEDNSSIVPNSIITTTETSSLRTSTNEPAPQSLQLDPTICNGEVGRPEYLEPSQALPSLADAQNGLCVTPVQPAVSPHLVPSRDGDPVDPAGVPSQSYYVFNRTLTNAQFQDIWKLGIPIVVSDLLDKFSIQWNPDYFIQNFGQQQCLILDCNTDENRSVDVGEFFKAFGLYEGRDRCWKLKDWPPSTDFKTTFPDLFDDFSKAVPVPNYTRRDGCLNIASYFPKNTVAPDLGPKMYNAFASSELPGFKGSTRLHMDMADAVNIMLYSAKRPDGGEGLAAWDIFRAEDSQKIRRFFRKYFKGQYVNDPIHAQKFYLDIRYRKLLYEEFGVRSCRIYQRPGDAVFIPAGCAHQVVNLADCIKVACDFVSPQNVDRCSVLTQEFRNENQNQTWKEDVLQLSAMLWFCWLNISKVERHLALESQQLNDPIPVDT